MKTICIYHSRDLDGWMSAAIVKKWFEENHERQIDVNIDIENLKNEENFSNILYLKGWDYGDDIPDLSSYDKIIMVDVAFPKEEMKHIYISMKNMFNTPQVDFIWIDHHKSAMDDVHKIFCEEGLILPMGIQDVEFAACELTWKYFFPDDKMPEIVRLLGRYDCFGHKGTNEEQKVLVFQYGARSIMDNYESCYNHLTDPDQEEIVEYILNVGGNIYNYLCTEARQTYKKAFPIKFMEPDHKDPENGIPWRRKFLCVNQERFNPINFGIDYHKERYDGFACFWLKDGKWNWSL